MCNSDLPSLLILPEPPSPPTQLALKAVYGVSITSTLTTLATWKLSKPAILEIVVPYTRIQYFDRPRSCHFAEIEGLLTGMYTLICVIATQLSVALDDDGGVDARVVFVAPDESAQFEDHGQSRPRSNFIQGPIVNVEVFAHTRRNWKYIFSTDGELDHLRLNQYMILANHPTYPLRGQLRIVPRGLIISPADSSISSDNTCGFIHSTVAVGGTFDHLHVGHKLLLTATALLLQPTTDPTQPQRRLIIGITGDELLKNKKYAKYLKSWQQRQKEVVDFLLTILLFSSHGKEELEIASMNEGIANGRGVHTRLKEAQVSIECVEIQDAFGPTITDESVTALIVSQETRSGGAAVNAKRQEKGWKTLEIFEVGVLDAVGLEEKSLVNATEEFASKISSTAYRKRKADSEHKSAL